LIALGEGGGGLPFGGGIIDELFEDGENVFTEREVGVEGG